MGRFEKQDERYVLLSRIPPNQNGRVVFRKKRAHARAYMLCVLALDDTFVNVLYKIDSKGTDDRGNACESVSFDAVEL